jgi:hypothetical protein
MDSQEKKPAASPSDRFQKSSPNTEQTSNISRQYPRQGRGPRFVITFTPQPGIDAIRSLRLLLKAAKRRFGLRAIDAYEDRSSHLQISNPVADEFRELRDEVVAERGSSI